MADARDWLRAELDAFWEWAYSIQGAQAEAILGRGEWADEYPQMPRIYEAVKEVVCMLCKEPCTEQDADILIEAIAIDNEGEHALDICRELPDCAIECPFRRAITSRFPDARWQIASLIGDIGDQRWKAYLQALLEDENEYVERRALLALAQIDPIMAEQAAFARLRHSSDYMRLAAVSVLDELHSPRLVKAIDLLRDDTFSYIREKIKDIEAANP